VYTDREVMANKSDTIIACTTIRPIRERKKTGNKRISAVTNYKQKQQRERNK
jgi:hypothetical protein